jgi:hypothetical protein
VSLCPVNIDDFAASAAAGEEPPRGLGDDLMAMWLARAGRWDEAHDLCQQVPGPTGAWVHAYLHRVEGDLGNAGYWYAVAGKTQPPGQEDLEEEWRAMVEAMLAAE